MFKTLMLTAAAIIMMATSLFAQSITGYGGIYTTTTDHNNYTMRWANLKAVSNNGYAEVTIEYNFATQSLIFANAKKSYTLFGGEVTLRAGAIADPVAMLMTCPNELATYDWLKVYAPFTQLTAGVYGEYAIGRFTARVSHSDVVTSSVSYGPLSAFYEGNLGGGFIIEKPFASRLLNLTAGYARLDNGDEQYSYQNNVPIYKGITAIAQVNWGISEAKVIGVAYEYAPKSFAKAFLTNDNGTNEGRFELTYSF